MTDRENTHPQGCEKHEYFATRDCPWCEIEELQAAMEGAATAANIAGAELKQLREEREKLIDGLRHYADERRYQVSWYGRAGEYTGHARDILKSIGIDV